MIAVSRTRCGECGKYFRGMRADPALSSSPKCPDCFSLPNYRYEWVLEEAQHVDELENAEWELTQDEKDGLADMKELIIEEVPEEVRQVAMRYIETGWSWRSAFQKAHYILEVKE